jgi:hypothetical protein
MGKKHKELRKTEMSPEEKYVENLMKKENEAEWRIQNIKYNFLRHLCVFLRRFKTFFSGLGKTSVISLKEKINVNYI